jgi:hypothetical protein
MTRISLSRPVRIGLAAALVMGLVAAAGVAAFNGEGENADRVVELLDDAGVTTDTAELDEFADEFGLGGAVRILWWAEAADVEPSVIAEMRDEGMGWGQIRKALAEEHEDFDLGPGIGPVMGGNGQGHGQGQAQGQGKNKGNGPGD